MKSRNIPQSENADETLILFAQALHSGSPINVLTWKRQYPELTTHFDRLVRSHSGAEPLLIADLPATDQLMAVARQTIARLRQNYIGGSVTQLG